LTTFDVEKNEILIKENINQMQEWALSNKLDFIKLLEEYKEQVNSGNITPQEIYSRRFWGWTRGDDLHWSDCAPDGLQYAPRVYYVLWSDTGIHDVISRPCQ
jgi:hypothetical protein